MRIIVRFTVLTVALVGLFAIGVSVQAQDCPGSSIRFVDLDGDGFNDNAPDHDGDGIPNGLDQDYSKYARSGDGYQHRYLVGTVNGTPQSGGAGTSTGIGNIFQHQMQKAFQERANRFAQIRQQFQGANQQHRFGSGDGSGSGGVGVGTGSGVCDGTGPKGQGGGRK